MMERKKAYLGIGSNLGDKREYLRQAIELLQKSDCIDVMKLSSCYETQPVGYAEQDWFLNMVVEISTGLDPYALLEYCQLIERELKRERNIRWGPRTIDVDILLYEGVRMVDDKLTIPHPRMKERGFVLIPLQEIAPGIMIEDIGVETLIGQLSGDEVRKCGAGESTNIK